MLDRSARTGILIAPSGHIGRNELLAETGCGSGEVAGFGYAIGKALEYGIAFMRPCWPCCALPIA